MMSSTQELIRMHNMYLMSSTQDLVIIKMKFFLMKKQKKDQDLDVLKIIHSFIFIQYKGKKGLKGEKREGIKGGKST